VGSPQALIRGTPPHRETVTEAAEELDAVAVVTDGHTTVIEEVVADKGVSQQSGAGDLAALDLADLHRGASARPSPMEEED